MVNRAYCDFVAPIYLGLWDFISTKSFVLFSLTLVGRELIVHGSSWIVGPVFFFAIGHMDVAFSKISVAVCIPT